MQFKRHIKKIGSSLLLVIFLFGVVPPEYLHDIFAGHNDGIDPILKKGEVVFMPKHTHCSFLGFEFTPFALPTPQFVVFAQTVFYCKWIAVSYNYQHSSLHFTTASRGPPMAV